MISVHKSESGSSDSPKSNPGAQPINGTRTGLPGSVASPIRPSAQAKDTSTNAEPT